MKHDDVVKLILVSRRVEHERTKLECLVLTKVSLIVHKKVLDICRMWNICSKLVIKFGSQNVALSEKVKETCSSNRIWNKSEILLPQDVNQRVQWLF